VFLLIEYLAWVFYGSILGRHEIMKNGCITFGLRVERKFTKREKGEEITAGVFSVIPLHSLYR
jgi:hypothetical protein